MLETSGLTTMLIKPSCRRVGVKASEMPNCLNSTVMVGMPEPPLLLCETGIGKFAARQEVGGVARHRDQRGLGQGLDQTLGFQRVEQEGQIAAAHAPAQGRRAEGVQRRSAPC